MNECQGEGWRETKIEGGGHCCVDEVDAKGEAVIV